MIIVFEREVLNSHFIFYFAGVAVETTDILFGRPPCSK